MRMTMAMTRRCWIVSSHHCALLLLAVVVGGSRSITWRNAIWRLEIREDLEQDLVRNHRHRVRLIDQRSNHRHRRDGLLHPWWSMSMTIWSPNELGVGRPLIGSNHMHLMARREGDETSMLVECNIAWLLDATIEE